MSVIQYVVLNESGEEIAGSIGVRVAWDEGVTWVPQNVKPVVDAVLAALPGYDENNGEKQSDVLRALEQDDAAEARRAFLALVNTDRRSLVQDTALRILREEDARGVDTLIEEILSERVPS